MVLSLAFTIAGIIGIKTIGWFPAIFFGICFLVFAYILFNPQKEISFYDERFLSSADNISIVYHDRGFTYQHEDNFYWDKIHAITAFKKDLITSDEICLNIEHEFDVFTISESFEGWARFKDEISKRFKLTEPKWFEKMTDHAFEDNEIILYIKQIPK